MPRTSDRIQTAFTYSIPARTTDGISPVARATHREPAALCPGVYPFQDLVARFSDLGLDSSSPNGIDLDYLNSVFGVD